MERIKQQALADIPNLVNISLLVMYFYEGPTNEKPLTCKCPLFAGTVGSIDRKKEDVLSYLQNWCLQ